jgi:Xaa-Pro aminopeptidase
MSVIKKIQAGLGGRGIDAILLKNGSNRQYCTGFRSSSGAVLITHNSAFFITDSRYTEAASKTVSGLELIESTGVRPERAIIGELVRDFGISSLGFEEDSVPYSDYLRLREKICCELVPAGELIAELRKKKSRSELELLVKAQRIAESAFEYILGILRPGVREREIAAELTYRMTLSGGQGDSFDPIAVAGKNSSMPHGVPGDYIIQNGDFLVMDFGCVYEGYCSDMTRTVAIGSADEEMRRVYNTVLQAQEAGIAAAKPGVSGETVDAAARSVIEEAGYGKYFGHSFGHSLGLDVHEEPRCAPNAKEILPEGTVTSAEPGIYLPGKFGVRIEDVLYLTGDGAENITKSPKTLIVI